MNLRTTLLLIGLPCTPTEARPAITPERWGGSKRKAGLLITAAFLAIAVAPLRAATIAVITTNDGGPGSLRSALAIVADGDTIDASGISGTILLTSGELLVTNSVDIIGPGPDRLAINGNRRSRVFGIGSGQTVAISSLTITNGEGFDQSGGGIYNHRATLTISNTIVCGNSAGGDLGGGGIYNDAVLGHANLIVVDSVLYGNSAGSGGGIYNDGEGSSASVQISYSTLSGNTASGDDGLGGAIYNDGDSGTASVEIVNSNLTGNQAHNGFGGAINNAAFDGGAASVAIVNSTLSGNSALIGGGIANDGPASVQIANSTLCGNSAIAGEGGINNGNSATMQILNSTLSSNSYCLCGGGGDVLTEIFNNGTMEIGSTILDAVAGGHNIGSNGGTVISLGYNLSSDDGGGYLTATGDQTNTDPMLGPLQDNGGPTFTCALLCGSPAIDQGTNFSGSVTDQRGTGFVRTFDDCAVPNAPGGDGTDIGAYEVQRGECPHPLTMSCPTNQTVNARSPAGARVNYPAPAASNGCPVSVVCNPPGGSVFAIGDTVVSCIATDSEGNEATCSFTVHVKGAPEQLADLIALVQSLNLRPWTTYVLTAELQSASNALRRGNARWACGDLDAFIFDVEVQTWWGQIWPPSRGSRLVRNAQRIRNVLGCDDGFPR